VIERERWESTRDTFRSQMATIIGDVLLSSAYLAYAGYFDQHVSVYIYIKLIILMLFYSILINGLCFILVSSKSVYNLVSAFIFSWYSI